VTKPPYKLRRIPVAATAIVIAILFATTHPWAAHAAGALLSGAGLVVFGFAVSIYTNHNERFTTWFWTGTLGIVMFNAGISLTVGV